MTGIWRQWLQLWCWGVIVFGIILAGAAFPATDAVARFLVTAFNNGPAFELDRPLRFGLGVQGALSIGLGLLIMAAVRAGDDLGQRGRSMWVLVTLAMAIWYIVDSAISIATGFTLNALSNTLFLAAFATPILASGVLRQSAAG